MWSVVGLIYSLDRHYNFGPIFAACDISRLCTALAHHREVAGVVRGICRSICTYRDRDGVSTAEFAAVGGLQLLSVAIKHAADRLAILSIFSAIGWAAGSEANRAALAAGVIPLAIAAVERHAEGDLNSKPRAGWVIEEAAHVFGVLASSADIRGTLAAEGVITVLVSALQRHSGNARV